MVQVGQVSKPWNIINACTIDITFSFLDIWLFLCHFLPFSYHFCIPHIWSRMQHLSKERCCREWRIRLLEVPPPRRYKLTPTTYPIPPISHLVHTTYLLASTFHFLALKPRPLLGRSRSAMGLHWAGKGLLSSPGKKNKKKGDSGIHCHRPKRFDLNSMWRGLIPPYLYMHSWL